LERSDGEDKKKTLKTEKLPISTEDMLQGKKTWRTEMRRRGRRIENERKDGAEICGASFRPVREQCLLPIQPKGRTDPEGETRQKRAGGKAKKKPLVKKRI